MFPLLLATAILSPVPPEEPTPTPTPAPAPVSASVSVEHIEQRDALLVTSALVLVFAATAHVVIKS